MGITIDHVAVPARDPEASARWLAAVLGAERVEPDGPDGDMFNVVLAVGAVLFVPAESIDPLHLAFRVDPADFDAVVERLRRLGLPFGNDPDDVTNGETSDFLGGVGRVYVTSPDGHLFEVTA